MNMARLYTRDTIRGPVWYIDYSENGRRIRRKLGYNRAAAERALRAVEGRLVEGRAGIPPKPQHRIDTTIDDYISYVESHRTTSTARRYRSALDHFREYTRRKGIELLADVDVNVLEAFHTERYDDRGAIHANYCVGRAGSMLAWAKKRGLVDSNPARRLTMFPTDPQRPRYLSPTEINRILDACTGEERALFVTAINTGLRAGEIENLVGRDVDLARGQIHIRGKRGWKPKRNKNRIVPMNTATREAIKSLPKYKPGDYIFQRHRTYRQWAGRVFKALFVRAGIKDATAHTCRHTFASHAAMSGVDLYVIRDLLGHSSVRQTEIYAHLAPDHRRDAVERLRFGPQIVGGTDSALREGQHTASASGDRG